MMGFTFAPNLVLLCLRTKVFIHGGFIISNFMMLSNLGEPQSQIRGRFGCGVPFKVLLCYVL